MAFGFYEIQCAVAIEDASLETKKKKKITESGPVFTRQVKTLAAPVT